MKKRKRLNNRGFTLLEAVVTSLMISLIGLAITVGITGAIRSYSYSLYVSEGDMLVNNLELGIGDLLRFSSFVEKDATTGTVYFSNEDYSVLEGCFVVKDGLLYLQTSKVEAADGANLVPLINRNSYSNQRISSFELDYDRTTMVFEGKYKLKDQTYTDLERELKFFFRTLREAKPII